MKREVNSQRNAEPDDSLIGFSVVINDRVFKSDSIRGDTLLIDYLHEIAELPGTRLSCGVGACSSCKVAARVSPTSPWIPLLACYARLSAINGMEVRTIEGLANGKDLHPLQRAFLEDHSFQCGFSTPGFLMAGFLLIDELKRNPIREEDLEEVVLRAINGHLCRCTGYVRYHRSICRTIVDLVKTGELSWIVNDPPVNASRVSFAVQKRSGNDQQVESVVGWFDEPKMNARIGRDNDLSTFELSVTVDLQAIRTGIAVRDHNVFKFLLHPFKSAHFELGRATFVGHDQTLAVTPKFPGGVPVRLDGEIVLNAEMRRPVRIRVGCLAFLAIQRRQLRIVSAAPITLDLLDLDLPVTEFAIEFGIKLDAQVDVTFDLQLDLE